jgi:hypothetical protein
MDVVISSGWRSSSSTISFDTADESIPRLMSRTQGDFFVTKHGRFEVTLSQERDGWLIEYTSSGRLFGPRELIYRAHHTIARHAAWDLMCRVIRATDNEQEGLKAMREAIRWLQARQSVC